jgi:hypothetical protein
MADASRAVPTQVRQVRKALLRDYEGLFDMSDVAQQSETEREQRFLSRALSALAVRVVTGCDAAEAAAHVIDGVQDQGIDAIAFVASPPHVYLIQSKWSDRGTAGLDQSAAMKLIDGLDRIDHELSNQFNPRGEVLAERAKDLMTNKMAPVTLVLALMGTSPIADGPAQVLDNAERKYNAHGAWLDRRVLLADDFYHRVREDLIPPAVDLTIIMDQWLQHSGPHQGFQGNVRAEDIAGWHEQHGARLFDLNIRNPLGTTRTNSDIISTLINEPANFWYFNNGITVLCDRIECSYRSRSAPHSAPVTLTAVNASVVNGAQTVTAISEAMSKDATIAANAVVSLRVIETRGAGAFAKRTTHATNVQNRVEPRDLVTLDPVQSEIRADLAAELDKEYTIKRGALEPAPDSGCSIDEAARALACAHSRPEYVARAIRALDLLWERGTKGAYDVLFHPQPPAYQIWRSVITVRAVRAQLHATKSRREGRAAAILLHGELLVAHLVLQHLGTSTIDDPYYDWATNVLGRVPEVTEKIATWLIHHLDKTYGATSQIASTFTSAERCEVLAKAVLKDMTAGSAVPVLPAEYVPTPRKRKPRRPNTVPFLVDTNALAEGTPLVFDTSIAKEREALGPWLDADPKRGQATWVNDRARPILWAFDQQQYSPSGLVALMWEQANWEERPIANQGTIRWRVAGGESLWEIASRIQSEENGE